MFRMPMAWGCRRHHGRGRHGRPPHRTTSRRIARHPAASAACLGSRRRPIESLSVSMVRPRRAAARTAAYAPVNRLPPAAQTFSCFAQGNDPIYPKPVISPYLAKLNLKEIDDLLQSQLESLSNLY
ncbi:hypothetical protein BVI434_3020031 [Burkholderia vietnamiensis]|nr:hypothetical protein BVI434_3020031 [Burkholderia vietnamiensis]